MEEEEEDEEQMNPEDELAAKFGFKKEVILDMWLPSGERECINDY